MIFQKIVDLLKEHREIEATDISLETKLDEMGLDSLDRVELVMALEEEYDIQIELDQSLVSVQDLVERIRGLCKEQGREVQ
ncbi:MAG: phosphopantetheine-binding protein [Bacillota bacterium]